MYSNNIVNYQESMVIVNAYKKSLETYRIHHIKDLYTDFVDNIRKRA